MSTASVSNIENPGLEAVRANLLNFVTNSLNDNNEPYYIAGKPPAGTKQTDLESLTLGDV